MSFNRPDEKELRRRMNAGAVPRDEAGRPVGGGQEFESRDEQKRAEEEERSRRQAVGHGPDIGDELDLWV